MLPHFTEMAGCENTQPSAQRAKRPSVDSLGVEQSTLIKLCQQVAADLTDMIGREPKGAGLSKLLQNDAFDPLAKSIL